MIVMGCEKENERTFGRLRTGGPMARNCRPCFAGRQVYSGYDISPQYRRPVRECDHDELTSENLDVRPSLLFYKSSARIAITDLTWRAPRGPSSAGSRQHSCTSGSIAPTGPRGSSSAEWRRNRSCRRGHPCFRHNAWRSLWVLAWTSMRKRMWW